MPTSPQYLLIVTAEVNPEVEADWNRWYDEVHLPDALKCPGFKRGQRYVSVGEITDTVAGKREKLAKRIYTTVYEIDSPAAIATPEFQAMRGWYQFAPHVWSRTQVVVATARGRPPCPTSSCCTATRPIRTRTSPSAIRPR